MKRTLYAAHLSLLIGFFALWYVLTEPSLLPRFFEDPNRPKFFFGQPHLVLVQVWEWFSEGKIYAHLWITLVETVYADVLSLGDDVVMMDAIFEDRSGRTAGLIIVAPDPVSLVRLRRVAA